MRQAHDHDRATPPRRRHRHLHRASHGTTTDSSPPGHGPVGDQCACFCRDTLPGNLVNELKSLTINDPWASEEEIKKALTSAFVLTNKQVLAIAASFLATRQSLKTEA